LQDSPAANAVAAARVFVKTKHQVGM